MEQMQQIQKLFAKARCDAQYAKLAQEYRVLEIQFENIVSRLTREEENTVWEYICTAEEMNYRMLEILMESGCNSNADHK